MKKKSKNFTFDNNSNNIRCINNASDSTRIPTDNNNIIKKPEAISNHLVKMKQQMIELLN